MCVGWGRDFDEHRPFCGDLANPIKHQRVQMRIEIGRTAKALDQGDGAGGGVLPLNARLFDEVAVEGTVDDLQHRGDEVEVDGKQAAQRYGE